jgi:hypothetical protein
VKGKKFGILVLVFLVMSSFCFAVVLQQEDFTSGENGTKPAGLKGEWDDTTDITVIPIASANPAVAADHTGGDGYVLQVGDLGSGGYNFAWPSSYTPQTYSEVECWVYFNFDGGITLERDYILIIHGSEDGTGSYYSNGRKGYWLLVTMNSSWGTYVPPDKTPFLLKRATDDSGWVIPVLDEGTGTYDTGWHKMRLEITNTGQIEGYIDDVLEVSATDTDYTSGFPVMAFYDDNATDTAGAFDNFIWTSSPPPPPPITSADSQWSLYE